MVESQDPKFRRISRLENSDAVIRDMSFEGAIVSDDGRYLVHPRPIKNAAGPDAVTINLERLRSDGDIQPLAPKTGLSKVFQAMDTSSGEPVAIKVGVVSLPDNYDTGELSPEGNQHLDSVLRAIASEHILREAIALSHLKHPNIVRLIEVTVATDDHNIYPAIVMEHIEGDTYQFLINNGRLPELGVMLDDFENLAEAVDYMHTQEVIHKDMKPGNILKERVTGRPIIIDFGLANYRQPDKTRAFGTPGYMSPNMFEGGAPEKADDVWGFACTCLAILFDKPPFSLYEECPKSGRLIDEVLNRKFRRYNYQQLKDRYPALKGDTEMKIQDLLFSLFGANAKDERPQSCEEVIKIIRKALTPR